MYNLASKNFIITGSEGQIGKGIVNELKRYICGELLKHTGGLGYTR